VFFNMLLKQRKVSQTNRCKFRLKKTVFIFKKIKFFYKGTSFRVPTNVRGLKTIRSRKTKSIKFNVIFNKTHNPSKLGVVSNVFMLLKSKTQASLIVIPSGIFFLKKSNYNDKLFSYFSDKFFMFKNKFNFINFHTVLGFLSKKTIISNIELIRNKGSQYVRSNGSKAVLMNINLDNGLALVKLPSGETKFFSAYSGALKGPSGLPEMDKIFKGDRFFKKIRGFGPKVRGVAKNPIDHPHGGNTKSIKFPRTPWGKATKLK